MPNIDWKQVDQWLQAGATGKLISERIGIHYNTLYESCTREHGCDFSEYKRQKRELGDEMLMIKGYEMAMKGDKTMLIFYLKNRCGFRDNPEPVNNEAETAKVDID